MCEIWTSVIEYVNQNAIWLNFDVFIVKFEQVSHIVLAYLLLNLNK